MKFNHIYKKFYHINKTSQYIIYKITFNIYETALHLACENNNLEIVKLLISNENLDINLFKEISSYY